MESGDDDAVELAEAMPKLSRSKAVKDKLRKEFGDKALKSILHLMRSGDRSGELPGEVHDFLTDEIGNEAEDFWSGSILGEEDSYPVGIRCYEGVYFVEGLEEGPFGYFLKASDAKSFLHGNWFGDIVED